MVITVFLKEVFNHSGVSDLGFRILQHRSPIYTIAGVLVPKPYITEVWLTSFQAAAAAAEVDYKEVLNDEWTVLYVCVCVIRDEYTKLM